MGLALGNAFGAALQPFLRNLAVLPDTVNDYLRRCFKLTREIFPDYVAELEGYAAGSGVSVQVLWQMLLEDDISALAPEKCTSLVTNNGRLIGHNEDWDADTTARLFVLRRNLAGRTLFELHYAGTLGGNALSINGSGIVQIINSLNDGLPLDVSVPRVPTNIIGRFVADSTDTVATITKLKNIPRMGGYAHSLIQAGKNKTHCLIELSQHNMALHEIATFPYVHANHYTLKDMLHFNRVNRESSKQRYAAAAQGTAADMQCAEVMTLLQDKSAGPDNSLMNDRNIAGMVLDLDHSCAWVRLASEPEKGWLQYKLGL